MADKPLNLSGMPNREALLKEATRLGMQVFLLKGTGEVRVITKGGRILTLNNRRKEGTQILLSELRKAQKETK